MSTKEIQDILEGAYHNIGHAYAHVGTDRPIAALQELDQARDAIKKAYDAIDESIKS